MTLGSEVALVVTVAFAGAVAVIMVVGVLLIF